MSDAESLLHLGRSEAIDLAYRARFSFDVPPDAIESAAAQLRSLGHVQIDTISVVERAHHHVFWSGDDAYGPECLPALERPPRRALEYWAHAAAYLPIEDYRYCLPRMRRIAETGHQWFPTDPEVVRAVLDRIRAEGPLRSCDFAGGDGPRGPWWDWKPAKAALEFLFMSGVILVAGRPGFQKLYDLAERVLPPDIDDRTPSDDEMADWYVRRAACAYGVFCAADAAYQRKEATAGVGAALERAAESGSIVEARLEGDEARRYWVSTKALECPRRPDDRPVRLLSPFDNYIIDRKRARRLLGLEYTLECYVPEAKRAFGYFALPIVWRGRPAGLVDAAADRKRKALVIKRVDLRPRPEELPGASIDEFRSMLIRELRAFAAFNGCDTIVGEPAI
ncbi:MAG TPA: crosslink repair DNA glycosylase YcaQ family protein [Spirochaetales bacterium]|nr:crosslink repair DNA glycosylase YcaQ family protein [Spirochaetales bacterium]